ncbi:polysaccharide deacetylase family protein [Gimesia aquarii]|uniref:Polysaccharide deacetylase n=1 Tax=Gimesia aquarii TaxID=2527964 RepID=A0A517VSL9_9PLAN|nr:polysaccharide deacetylase family protein [Gimesia aquarii]QDT95949.1 Polysaccharide deacetylase [Gimesia aquarii]
MNQYLGPSSKSKQSQTTISRRQFLSSSAATVAGLSMVSRLVADEEKTDLATNESKALIAISYDLEMSAGYPIKGKPRNAYPWDHQKGNLNDETKQYTVESCRIVKEAGGVLHSFLVGQVLEHKNVDWLKQIIQAGHPIGNHTYDHVRITAKNPNDIQYRFQRAPWLIKGKTPAEVISENIRLCELAMRQRLGIKPAGFRTPYAFANGIADRVDLQEMLLSLGYTWTSSQYRGPTNVNRKNPTKADFDAFIATHKQHQPYVYPTGLIEVPFSPPMDVGAFRGRSWKLDDFLQLIEKSVLWAIENRATYDFGVHPSVMYVEDPEFKAIKLICNLVKAAGDRAAIVDLDTFARRARQQYEKTKS